MVLRRCCPSSEIGLKKWRAHWILDHYVISHLHPRSSLGSVVARISAEVACRLPRPSSSLLLRLAPRFHPRAKIFNQIFKSTETPCQRASWAAEPILLSSFTYEYLARTCCGRGNPDTTQRALLQGRVTKEEGPFSRGPPFSLEPHGPRHLF